MLHLSDIRAAADRLRGIVTRTPVIRNERLNALVGATVLLKAENLQRTGSFKLRGAYNAIAALSPAERAKGVVAFSSGNHAQAVALAARLLGCHATIVMPTDAPAFKVDATRSHGAGIVLYDRYTEDREAIGRELAEKTGASVIPPFDHPAIMAGQGTAVLELIEDSGPLDALFVCTGGGGLLAGSATAATALCPGVRVYGVEPEAGDDHVRSLAAGHPVGIDVPHTIADGLQTQKPGALTFEVNRRFIAGVRTVSDAELVSVMAFLFEQTKLVVEPSGAAALAGLLKDPGPFKGQRVGVTLSGGNISLQRFMELTRDARAIH